MTMTAFKIGETIRHRTVGTVGKIVSTDRMYLNGKAVSGLKVWVEAEKDFKFLPDFNLDQFESI